MPSEIEQLYHFYKTPYTYIFQAKGVDNMGKGGFNKKNVVGIHVKTKKDIHKCSAKESENICSVC